METIEIKDVNGVVLFSHTAENNSITLTVETAVSCGVSLSKADLAGACLAGACLAWADLAGANLESANLAGADLKDANLKGAILNGANLAGADLGDAELAWADLIGANLEGANLESANLAWADLADANLKEADLKDANLKGAFLEGADLTEADITGAVLNAAHLNGAQNIPYIPLACPSEGAFIGWKKVEGKYLVKLQVPEDARRLSATSRKCRCDMAKVLDITSLDGNKHYDEVTNTNYKETIYKAGEMVYPDLFDENRWIECSHGIHFFINKEDAINY